MNTSIKSYQIKCAIDQDAEALTELVNLAYRPKNIHTNAWTHESTWVEGERITKQQIINILAQAHTNILILSKMDQIIACVQLQQQDKAVEIGLLSVYPEYQNQGMGKLMLNAAEQWIIAHWKNVQQIKLSVMTVRQSLLQFYLRRGYQHTGIFFDYPTQANVGQPKCALQFEYLIKNI